MADGVWEAGVIPEDDDEGVAHEWDVGLSTEVVSGEGEGEKVSVVTYTEIKEKHERESMQFRIVFLIFYKIMIIHMLPYSILWKLL